MIWSISGYKQFNKCRRRWYYTNIVADGRVKNDAYRKEVTILSRLQTLDAWRGTIVDDIISRLLVNAINNKIPLQKDYFLREAMNAFNDQLEYAIFQTYRNPGSKTSDKNFASLLNYDLGLQIEESELDRAKQDIYNALNNLLDNVEFLEYLKSAKILISQRSLLYPFDRFNVRSKPDLIAFFEDSPPHIFDWKVHTFGTATYDEQLISYGVALYKTVHSKPHIDFPESAKQYSIYDYKLTEYQLLHPERIRRDYQMSSEAIEDLSLKISGSLIEMYMSGCHKKYSESDPESFSTTSFIESCHNCPFKKICKQNNHEIRSKYLQN
ncbi:MAG: PD-(D/E)XK nuclease family protein [Mucilaginibacter sp.]